MEERKYFLDWLRVIAFALLIVFHAGLLYVSWDYNLKSPRIFPNLEWLMIALNPWRLALLFFISGVACRHLMAKLDPGPFGKDRLIRLVPVIIFGMMVVNPTQTYIELYSKEIIDSGYLQFWIGSYIVADPSIGIPMPRWDHLWFLLYLLFYIFVVFILYGLRKNLFASIQVPTFPVIFLILGPGIWLASSNILVSEIHPTTFNPFDDWANHIRWSGLFAIGLLCAKRSDFWTWLQNYRAKLGFIAIALLLSEWGCRAYWQTGNMNPFWDTIIFEALKGLYGWAMIMTLIGYASIHMIKPSKILSYLTVAVLPIYVLHQPILLITAYYVFPIDLPVLFEGLILVLSTGLISLLIYELLIRHFGLMRFFFGLKQK